MITCVNDRRIINVDYYVSNHESFLIELDDGHKYLYKRVSFDDDSKNFTYMRIRERLGKTIFDFCIIRKDHTRFRDIVSEQYSDEVSTYTVYKLSKIEFTNIDVTYSY